MTEQELDVRPLRKPDKHPTIFATYDSLAVGEAFVLINNHDPRHLRDEFDTDVEFVSRFLKGSVTVSGWALMTR